MRKESTMVHVLLQRSQGGRRAQLLPAYSAATPASTSSRHNPAATPSSGTRHALHHTHTY
ncbi:hypothetical protein RR46_01335 [Papilio xuthus]|uniref:Uncharacterized protein n=1 Tax=Papilio xuthus TaxID=66420 RepID=A0A0N0PAA6_PAPXU|nr:hypothetical protein RR46_01335 [Papilio xuthus]